MFVNKDSSLEMRARSTRFLK